MLCLRALTVASLTAFAAACCMPRKVEAQSRWIYSVTAPTHLERDSNPAMTASAPSPVTRVRLAPDVHALYKSDRHEVELSAGVDLERSSDERVSANRSDPRLRADWRSQSTTAAYGFYLIGEQRAYRAVDVIDQVPLGTDGTRTLAAIGGTWSANITETTSIGGDLREERVRFDTPETADYQLTTANAQIVRFTREEGAWYLSANAQAYRPESTDRVAAPSAKSDSYGFMLGYRGKITQEVEWEAGAGPVRLEAQVAGTTWQANLRGSYELPRLRASIAVSRRPSVASADAGLGMSTLLNGQVRYALDALSSVTLDVNASRIVAQTSTRASNFTMTYARQLSPFWTFAVRPEFRQRADHTGTAQARVIALTLTYSHPDL